MSTSMFEGAALNAVWAVLSNSAKLVAGEKVGNRDVAVASHVRYWVVSRRKHEYVPLYYPWTNHKGCKHLRVMAMVVNPIWRATGL